MEGPNQTFLKDDELSARCGCYARNSNTNGKPVTRSLVPLKNIDYNIEIVNSLVNIKITQKYYNPLDIFLQVDYSMPIDPNSCIYKVEAVFKDTKIEGIVKQRYEAEKQYDKAKKQGMKALIGKLEEKSKDIFNFQIGNIPPKTEFVVNIQVLQQLALSMNIFYKLLIPSTISPRYMSKIDQEVPMPKKRKGRSSGRPDFQWTFKINVRNTHKIRFFNSPSHKLVQLNKNFQLTELMLSIQNSAVPNNDFIFYYTTQNFHLPNYVLGSTDESSTVMISFIPKFCELEVDDAYQAALESKPTQTKYEVSKGNYIFLLDRSGSMEGPRINKAKQALILFLKSLPEDSYFNVVSFGSNSEKLFGSSEKYSTNSMKEAIEKIEPMTASMGGTEIYAPLKQLLSQPIKQGYLKHIFILTDGGVTDTERIINLVKNNTKYCRVHTIGVGNGASLNLIKGCAEKGKGKHIMISDSESSSQKIIELLDSALSPLIDQVKLSFNETQVKSVIPNPKSIPYILKDQIVTFYITFKQHLTQIQTIVFEYEDPTTKQMHKSKLTVKPSSPNYPFVDKMSHFKVLRQLQNLAESNDDKENIQIEDCMFYVKVKDYKKQAIKYSVDHQVLSKFTAFLCVGKKLVDGEYQQFQSKGADYVSIQQYRAQQKRQAAQASRAALFSGRGKVGTKRVSCDRRSSYVSRVTFQPRKVSSSESESSQQLNECQQQQNECYQQSDVVGKTRLKQKCPTRKSKKSVKNEKKSMKKDQQEVKIQKMKGKLKQETKITSKSKTKTQPKSKSKPKSKSARQPPQTQTQKQVQMQPNMPQQTPRIAPKVSVLQIITSQNANGSWSQAQFVKKLSKNGSKVSRLIKQLSAEVVITKLVILWIEKNLPERQYSLVLRKAKIWLSKVINQRKIEESKLKDIECI